MDDADELKEAIEWNSRYRQAADLVGGFSLAEKRAGRAVPDGWVYCPNIDRIVPPDFIFVPLIQ